MRTDADCIFCKIVAGEIPSFKLHEDDHTIAFMDINPANPGHALAVVKEHWPTVHDLPDAVLGPLLATAQRVARAVEVSLSPAGINLVQANGPGAAQSVPHVHIHVVPRARDDGLALNWGHSPGDMDEIKATYEKVLAAMDG